MKEESRDIVAISPVGKKQSLIEQLMKQEENLREMKDSKIASAAGNDQAEVLSSIKDKVDRNISVLKSEF